MQRFNELRSLLQSPFIKLDQIEIGPNIFATVPACFFEEMLEARFFRGRIRMTRNHRVVPLFDGFWRMLHSVFLYPRRNCFVMFKLVGDLFKYVAVDFKECQQMFVEPDGFIVVTVKQAFPVQPGLIDQTRQMNITAESFVRTAWMQSSHEPDGCYVAGNGRATGSGKLDSVVCEAIAGRSCSNSPCVRPT